jgi:hypothetical protein
MGRKAELGHVLVKLFVINAPWFPDLSDVAPSCQFALAADGLNRTILHQVRPNGSCPARVACRCPRSNSARHFRTCFIKEDIGSPDEVPIRMDGEELGHVREAEKTTVGVSAFTERYCIKGAAQRLLSCQSCVRCPIKFRSSFQNLFYQRYWLSDARYRFTWEGVERSRT